MAGEAEGGGSVSTCARCGLPIGGNEGQCDGGVGPIGTIECRDRQLALLHAQLRSVTRKVELAHEELAQEDGAPIERCRELLIQVLEALS